MKLEYLKSDLLTELEKEQKNYTRAVGNSSFEDPGYIMQKIKKIQSALLELMDKAEAE